MALNVTLRINTEFPFGYIEARRIFGGSEPGDLNHYHVEIIEIKDGRSKKVQEFVVYDHRYGDGGMKLLKRIMENI